MTRLRDLFWIDMQSSRPFLTSPDVLSCEMTWKEWLLTLQVGPYKNANGKKCSKFQLQLIASTCSECVIVWPYLTQSMVSIKTSLMRRTFHRIVDESHFRQMTVIKINQDLRWKKTYWKTTCIKMKTVKERLRYPEKLRSRNKGNSFR